MLYGFICLVIGIAFGVGIMAYVADRECDEEDYDE